MSTIFVTLGSQKFQFNRLLRKLDQLIEEGILTDSVFAQIGESDYQPVNYQWQRFLSRDDFIQKVYTCDFVITHGGTGAIITAVKLGKPVIAVPRKSSFGEHVDDHQFQIVEQFSKSGFLTPCYEMQDLASVLEKVKQTTVPVYVSNTKTILRDIRKYMEKDS